MKRYTSKILESKRLDSDTEEAIIYLQNKYLQFYKRDMDKFVELVADELKIDDRTAQLYLKQMHLV